MQMENKRELKMVNLEQYDEEVFLSKLSNKLKKSEKEYENGQVHDARKLFGSLRKKYEYWYI